MAKKENIESGKLQQPESVASDDATSKGKKVKQDLDSDKRVKDNSKSKSLDIQGASSEPGANHDAHPETSQTAPAPENPSEIMPADQPSAELSEVAVEASSPEADVERSASLNVESLDNIDEAPTDTDHAGDEQPQAPAAEMDPENEKINTSAAEDAVPVADEKESAPANTEQNAGEANSENSKTDRVLEAQKSDPDEADKKQASTDEKTIPEATAKTDANENEDADQDMAHPPQPDDQKTGQEVNAADDAVEAQTIEKPDSNDAATDPSASEDQETGQEKAAADDAAEAQTTKKADTDDDTTEPSAPEDQVTPAEDSVSDDDIEDEPSKADGQRKSTLKIAVSAMLIVAVFSGFFIFENKSRVKNAETKKAQALGNHAPPSRTHRKEVIDIQPSVTPSRYDSQINEISALRDTLLKKQAEVLALKQSYQSGIEELEKEIFDELRKADLQTFLQATDNKRILFRLKTIQRRQAYIRQLEAPYAWVSRACEQLLYLKRRVKMDLQVSEVASGIDMNRHARQMQAALQKYQPTAEKLAVDPTHAQSEALDSIWQRIQNKKSQYSAGQAQSRNQIISDQICLGNFSRLSELSEISVETAKCMNQLKAVDLFLNRLTEISPGSARQLCQWKGSWMSLNGIKALSPRVAHYLFQWDGNWISLNGLTEFPAEIGEMLLNWQGKQLELMGLQYAGESDARIAIEYLAQWEQSGGKLFVPQHLRNKIDALHRQPG